jgi:hypothetical protein
LALIGQGPLLQPAVQSGVAAVEAFQLMLRSDGLRRAHARAAALGSSRSASRAVVCSGVRKKKRAIEEHIPRPLLAAAQDEFGAADAFRRSGLIDQLALAAQGRPVPWCSRVRLWKGQAMKVTVELSDQEMAEVLKLTGERKKGPAIRRLMEEALQQRRRAQIAQRFLSGEWGVELETFEADQERERLRAQAIAP